MPQFDVYLDDLEDKILYHIAASPTGWIYNLVEWQARLAKDEIAKIEIARMIADPNTKSIPSDHDQIVLQADIKSAAERQTESQG